MNEEKQKSSAIGCENESKAVEYLKQRGFKIIERNYKSRFGEIDVIAKDGEDLVFIEVKYRTSDSFGHPGEFVDALKQKKIIKSALEFVKFKKYEGKNIRFDVVNIEPDKIEHLKSAFMTDGYYY
jgi:putative endonuclease